MISVLINNYNNGPWLRACVDSVLTQTLLPDEIIVCDDGSTDHSLDILRSYGSRLILIRGHHDHSRPGYVSQGAIIANAFANATGNHLYLLDGDDCYLPNHIECYEALWQTNPAFVMIHGSMAMIDANGKHASSLYRTDRDRLDYRRDIYRYNETDYFYPTSSLAFRRDFLLHELPLDFSDGMMISTDARLSFAAVFSGPIGFVRQDTTLYRLHANSLSEIEGRRKYSRLEETRHRAEGFNFVAHKRGQPRIRLWLNLRYLLQLARITFPAWLTVPFVKWKLSHYRQMPNRRSPS